MKCPPRGKCRLAAASVAAALVAACAQPMSRPAAPTPTVQDAAIPRAEDSEDLPLLQLGAGDLVRMQVAGRPELGTSLYVSDDGTLPVPLAGAVAVAGLSPAQAARKIAAAFRAGQILVNPQVTLLIDRFQSQRISVLGEVHTPGRLPLESRTTVFDALAQAGGTTDDASDIVYVLRTGPDGAVTRQQVNLRGPGGAATAPLEIKLRGGDAVYVPRADTFYIHGEVRAASMYRIEPGMTVIQAVARGGGVTARGSERRVEIRRRTNDGRVVEFDARPTEKVMPGDVIRVKERLF